jgi:uncharacterized membrane protein
MTARGSRILVVASVVLNVFLAGALAGGVVWLMSSKPGPGTSLESAGGQLPEEDRTAFRNAMRAVRHDSHQIILDGQQARREAAALLQQPTLDAAALLAALQRTRDADVTVRTRLEQRIVEFAAASSVEDRRLLAEGLVRHGDPQPPTLPKKSP